MVAFGSIKGGHDMDALGPSPTRLLYPREPTDMMHHASLSGSAGS